MSEVWHAWGVMHPPVHIRDAVAADCSALSALCLRSKAHWGYDDAFLRCCRPALTISASDLPCMTVRIAEGSDGRLLGVSAMEPLMPPGQSDEAELSRLFVEPGAMGRGIGRALMNDVRSIAQAQGIRVLWILSDPSAEPFYLHLGAVRVGLQPSDTIPNRTLPWLRLFVGDAIDSTDAQPRRRA